MNGIFNRFVVEHPILEWSLALSNEFQAIKDNIDMLFSMYIIKDFNNNEKNNTLYIPNNASSPFEFTYNTSVVNNITTTEVLMALISQHCFSINNIYSGDWWFLHGGAVRYKNSAILLLAGTGTGKSTLVCHLCSQGFEYMTDDIIPINKNSLAVVPFPKPIYLRNIDILKDDIKNDSMFWLYEDVFDFANDSRYVVIPNISVPVTTYTPIASVIILDRKINTEPQIKCINGNNAFMSIISNSREFLGIRTNLEMATRLSTALPVYTMSYSEAKDCVKLIKSTVV